MIDARFRFNGLLSLSKGKESRYNKQTVELLHHYIFNLYFMLCEKTLLKDVFQKESNNITKKK